MTRAGPSASRRVAVALAVAAAFLAAPAAGQDLPDETGLPAFGSGEALPAEPGAVDERVILNGLATMPASAIEAFTARPLFSPSRRPPPVAEPEPTPLPAEEPVAEEPVPEEPPTAPTMQLTGTFEGPDGIAALMRDPSTGESLTARLGDDVEGWAVTAITPTSITLELDGAVLDLALFEPTPVDEIPGDDGTSGDGGGWGGEDPTMGPVPNDWSSPDDAADGGGGETGDEMGPGGEGDGGMAGPPEGEARSARPPGARPPRRGFDPAALGLDPTMSGG